MEGDVTVVVWAMWEVAKGILPREGLPDAWDGICEKSESAPERKGVYGEAVSSTTWPSSRAYHDISSSSVRSPSGSASVNSSAVAELALGCDSRALVDHERVDLCALGCGGFVQLRRAGDKVEAWSFVVVVGRE